MPPQSVAPPLSSLLLWQDEDPHDGPANMAIDEALLMTVSEPVLRVYRWSEAAVSFGCFVSLAAARATLKTPRPLVRRWTGGGIVPHGDDWTYSLIVPAGERLASLSTAERYRTIHEALAAALDSPEVSCSLAEAPPPALGGVCFEQPVPADVLSAGRKIAGAAQRRSRHGVLHQGSVQGIVPRADVASRLASALVASPRESCPLDTPGWALVHRLAEEQYRTSSWLERRP